MMSLLFIALAIAVILAWMGRRNQAIFCFYVTLISATAWFLHHANSTLNLQL